MQEEGNTKRKHIILAARYRETAHMIYWAIDRDGDRPDQFDIPVTASQAAQIKRHVKLIAKLAGGKYGATFQDTFVLALKALKAQGSRARLTSTPKQSKTCCARWRRSGRTGGAEKG